ncbi:MAG: TlpA disulfide reductase family protein [Dehalococcoidia bacterium]|jgi:peroxiredoxin
MNISKTPLFLWILLSVLLFSVAVVAVIDRVNRSSPQAAQSQPLYPTKSEPADILVGNQIGDTAPDFTLETIDGRQISLSDYRGKNVILNFWATWCGPCRLETSTVEAVQEAWADKDVVVLGVNVQDGFESATTYARANNLKFTIAVDVPGDTVRLYDIHGIPTTFFINRKGIINAVKIGPFISTAEVEEMMASFK